MKDSLRCRLMIGHIYARAGDRDYPFRFRLALAMHILFCPRCAGKAVRLENARELLRSGFFPGPEPGRAAAAGNAVEDRIMEKVAFENIEPEEDPAAAPDFRSWVIGGIIIMLSLGTVILGLDFSYMAASAGSSYLIPVGLTVGGVVTVYGALFIGSHMKELSDRFGRW